LEILQQPPQHKVLTGGVVPTIMAVAAEVLEALV
jgi:hypothetical protein